MTLIDISFRTPEKTDIDSPGRLISSGIDDDFTESYPQILRKRLKETYQEAQPTPSPRLTTIATIHREAGGSPAHPQKLRLRSLPIALRAGNAH